MSLKRWKSGEADLRSALAHSTDAFLQSVSNVQPFPFTLSRSRPVALISDLFYLLFRAAAGPHALTACCSLPGCVFLFKRNNKSIRKLNEIKDIKE